MVWPADQSSIRSQSSISSQVHMQTMEETRDHSYTQHGLPSPNGWQNRTGQLEDQTILADILQSSPRQLGGPNPLCRILPQHVETLHYKEIPV